MSLLAISDLVMAHGSVSQKNIHAGGDVAAGNIVKQYFLSDSSTADQVRDILQHYLLEGGVTSEDLKRFPWDKLRDKFRESDDYDQTIADNPMDPQEIAELNRLLRAAGIAVRSLNFGTAHSVLGQAVDLLGNRDRRRRKIYKEFLLTGLIHYASINDMEGLNRLAGSNHGSRSLDVLRIANDALQERSSRALNPAHLKTTAKIIERMFKVAPDRSRAFIANSLGLAYRRIGERGDISLLRQAISTFNDGIRASAQGTLFEDTYSTKETLAVELHNNKAIALIRAFELDQDSAHLDISERCLTECIELIESNPTTFNDPRHRLIAPSVYNNFGNLHKQRLYANNEMPDAESAINYYESAMEFWDETSFPYFWAIIRKNVGEVKYIVGARGGDSTQLIGAFDCLMESLKYRTSSNSPHQWLRSIEILFDVLLSGGREVFVRALGTDGPVLPILRELATLPDLDLYERKKDVTSKAEAVKAKLLSQHG